MSECERKSMIHTRKEWKWKWEGKKKGMNWIKEWLTERECSREREVVAGIKRFPSFFNKPPTILEYSRLHFQISFFIIYYITWVYYFYVHVTILYIRIMKKMITCIWWSNYIKKKNLIHSMKDLFIYIFLNTRYFSSIQPCAMHESTYSALFCNRLFCLLLKQDFST